MILCKYIKRGGEDIRLEWFGRDDVPEVIQGEDGTWWDYCRPIPRDQTLAVAPADSRFVSYQLPRWYKYAPRHDEKGRCLFTSQREAIETAKRASADGECVGWDR